MWWLLLLLPCRIIAVENWPWSGAKDASTESAIEGQSVNLKCAGRIKDAPAHWDFKACGTSTDLSCSEVIEDDSHWKPLQHNTSVLSLSLVSRRQAGLYRCRQAATPLINIFYTIHLEVMPFPDDELPQFLDDLPKNVTVHSDMQAVFQCKVSSKTPVSITWFWQGSAPGAFRHSDKKLYVPVGGGTAGLPGGASLAKLVLPRPRARHAGKYYCVAVNSKGFSNSSAYLEVISEEEVQSEETHYFLSFFLLPIGMALVPACIWLYYIWNRNRRLKSLEENDQKQNVEAPLNFDNFENCVLQC